MQAQFQALVRVIKGIPDNPPKNLLEATQRLPLPGALPSPLAAWLLVWLFAHRERQQWAKEFVREHLPEAIPPSRRLYQEWEDDPPVELDLPGAGMAGYAGVWLRLGQLDPPYHEGNDQVWADS